MSELLKLEGSFSLQMLHHHFKMKISIKGLRNNNKKKSFETPLLQTVSFSKAQKSQHFHDRYAVLENCPISPAYYKSRVYKIC